MAIPTTYLYQKTNEFLDEIEANTGLTPSAKVWSLADQASITFPDALDSGQKATLDDDASAYGYSFVSQIP